jgi:hypothetical protein
MAHEAPSFEAMEATPIGTAVYGASAYGFL